MLDHSFLRGTVSGQSLANLNIICSNLLIVDVSVAASQHNEVATASKFMRANATGLFRFAARVLFKVPQPKDYGKHKR